MTLEILFSFQTCELEYARKVVSEGFKPSSLCIYDCCRAVNQTIQIFVPPLYLRMPVNVRDDQEPIYRMEMTIKYSNNVNGNLNVLMNHIFVSLFLWWFVKHEFSWRHSRCLQASCLRLPLNTCSNSGRLASGISHFKCLLQLISRYPGKAGWDSSGRRNKHVLVMGCWYNWDRQAWAPVHSKSKRER